ncbi:DUF4260 family protein [Rhodobacteraceae bacterium]|nr:DUF4260 family protein [Paracoccaceae bacterium]
MPLGLFGDASFGCSASALDVGLIWLSHIAFDRMIGAGLKDPRRFSVQPSGRLRREGPGARPGPLGHVRSGPLIERSVG